MVEPSAGYGRTARPGPPGRAVARRTRRAPRVTGADTADAERPDTDTGRRTSTPGHWTPNACTSRARTLDCHTGHRTPDTGRVDTTDYADRAPRHGWLRTDILDHHDQRTARWDAEPWTCGRRLRRSATMTARRGWVSASARLPTALPGVCSVAPSARPRLGALLSSERFRVESRANGEASSVMARPEAAA
jgi:hypothetical protein